MIIESPRDSPLRGLKQEYSHVDRADEALDMLQGILGALRCAVYPHTETIITTDEVYRAVDAALYLTEKAQVIVNDWHNQTERELRS